MCVAAGGQCAPGGRAARGPGAPRFHFSLRFRKTRDALCRRTFRRAENSTVTSTAAAAAVTTHVCLQTNIHPLTTLPLTFNTFLYDGSPPWRTCLFSLCKHSIYTYCFSLFFPLWLCQLNAFSVPFRRHFKHYI